MYIKMCIDVDMSMGGNIVSDMGIDLDIGVDVDLDMDNDSAMTSTLALTSARACHGQLMGADVAMVIRNDKRQYPCCY